MIARIAEWAVARRRAVIVVTLLLFAASWVPALDLPLDALPDLTNNQVIVLTNAPGLSPEEVEQTVTRPVELALSGLSGLREQRSLSRYGISSVTVVFEDQIDAWLARQMVSERIGALPLPAAVDAPALAPMTGGLGEIYHLALSSSVRPPAELLELSSLRVAPLLRAVKGVVEVNSWGGAIRTFDVIADASSLAARGLTLRKLQNALIDATGVNAAGTLLAHDRQVLLRAQARPQQSADLANAIVAEPAVRAGDVARTQDGELLRLGAATDNGAGETVYLMVQMLRDENALEVVRRIHETMPAVRAALPDDVRIKLVYDRSVLVTNTLRTVAKNLLEGFLLVTAVLLAFLGSFRAGIIAASVNPLSMALATSVMALLKLPGNLMSLGALDFGLLVDGAVVMVEGVFHSMHQQAAADWTQRVRETAAR
jgi:cobalt-zinc-cadmium resistance protein CzcA